MATKSTIPTGAQSSSRKSWLLRLALIAMGALTIVFLSNRLSALLGTPAPEEPIVPAVEVEIASARSLEVYQRYTGTIAARERFQVAAQINATVLAVPKREGERVLAGELLAVLDAAEFRAEVARQQATIERQQAELTYWDAQLDRIRALHATSAVSQQAFEDSMRQVRSLRASIRETLEVLAQAETRLSYTEIRAPSDGYVQSVSLLPGDLARTGAPLMELLDDRTLKVIITVPQNDLATLRTGAGAVVEIATLSYRSQGALDRLYPALDPQTRTATGEVFLDDTPEEVRPGMLASVSLPLLQIDAAITVPMHAIHFRNGTPGVFVDNEGTAQWRAVETGYSADERLHVVAGVMAGEAVIVTPDSRLADGIAILRAPDKSVL